MDSLAPLRALEGQWGQDSGREGGHRAGTEARGRGRGHRARTEGGREAAGLGWRPQNRARGHRAQPGLLSEKEGDVS